MNRRSFFASSCAAVAALIGWKPKVTHAKEWGDLAGEIIQNQWEVAKGRVEVDWAPGIWSADHVAAKQIFDSLRGTNSVSCGDGTARIVKVDVERRVITLDSEEE